MFQIAIALLLTDGLARAEFVIEAGPNYVRDRYSESATVLLQMRLQDKYAFGVGYMSEHCVDNPDSNFDCEWKVSEQFMAGAERIFDWRKWSIGIGLYYVDTLSRISSGHWNMRSSLEFAISEHFAVKFSHLSNGGTGSTMTDCSTQGYCETGQFNLGINTLLLAWQF